MTQARRHLIAIGAVLIASSFGTVLGQSVGRSRVGAAMFPRLEVILRNDVREELELVPDQVAKLRELQNETRQRARELFARWRDEGINDRDEVMKSLAEFRAEQNESLRKVLLPHQSKRFDQVYFQFRARARGGIVVLIANDAQIANQLGLSDSELQRTKEISTQIQRELQQKIRELRQQAHKKLLDALTPEQRIQVENLIGPPFEFQERGRTQSAVGNSR